MSSDIDFWHDFFAVEVVGVVVVGSCGAYLSLCLLSGYTVQLDSSLVRFLYCRSRWSVVGREYMIDIFFRS